MKAKPISCFRMKSARSCFAVLFLASAIALTGCGVPAATTTTGSLSTTSATAATSRTTAATNRTDTTSTAAPETTATAPATEPTAVSTTIYQPPATTAVPSVLLERWPTESSLPPLYTPNRANASAAKPLAGMTVLLDAGHGGADPGAVAADGTGEKTINLPIALKTRTLLESMGATVVMNRTDDSYLSIYCRVAKTGLHILGRASGLPGFAEQFDLSTYQNDFNAMISANTGDRDGAMTGRGMHLGFGVREEIKRLLDLERQFTDTIVVSIHANSSGASTDARGLQIYYGPTEYIYNDELEGITEDRDTYHWGYPVFKAYTGYNDAARASLAGSVYSAVAGLVPELAAGASAGVRAGNYGILRENALTNILVETGFISNPEDLAILKDDGNQDRIAQGVANGILAYFTSIG